VPHVGRAGVHGLLVLVQGQRKIAPVREPEGFVEGLFQRFGAVRASAFDGGVTGRASQQRASNVGGVGVGLNFAEGYGRFGHPAVGEVDPIPGVLPALVHQSVLVGALVFDEAVAVAVSVLLHPFNGAVSVREEGVDDVRAKSPPAEFAEG
jgi:hypothetical protein